MTAAKNLGGRPQGSAYLDALKTLGGLASVDDVQMALIAKGMNPTRDTVYQRLKQLQGEGRVDQTAASLFSLPSAAPARDTADARLDKLLGMLVRAGILPYDHGV